MIQDYNGGDTGRAQWRNKPYNDINLPANPSEWSTKWAFQCSGAKQTTDNTEAGYINNNNW